MEVMLDLDCSQEELSRRMKLSPCILAKTMNREARDLDKGKRLEFKSSTNKIHFLGVKETRHSITTYLGEHFINDPMYALVGDDCVKFKNNQRKRGENAEFQGVLVVATRDIWSKEEILIDYGEQYYTDTNYCDENNAKA